MNRSLTRLAVGAVVFALVACGRGDQDQSAADVVGTLLPDTSAARINEYQTKGGLSREAATFLAWSRVSYLKSEKNAYRFVAAFPTGMTANMTIKVTPNQPYTLSPEEAAAGSRGGPHNATLTHSVAGTTLTLRFEYVLPGGAIPAAYRDRPQRAAPRLASTRRTASTPVRWASIGTQATEGVGVVVETIFTQGVSDKAIDIISSSEEAMWRSMGIDEIKGKKVGSVGTAAACAVLEVVDVLSSSADYKDLMKELDGLQAAAENPTNNLTRDAYEKDPGMRDRILDEIADVRSDIRKAYTVNTFSSGLATGAGLIPEIGPVLSFAIAPAVSFTSDGLEYAVGERMRAVRNMVTTGFVSNKQPSSGGMQTGHVDCSPEVDTERPLTGTWTAMYQGIHEQFDSEGKLFKSITEKGTISFTVNGDQVSGDGSGQATYDLTVYEGRTVGTTSYQFGVAGYVNDGRVLLGVQPGPTPLLFDAVYTARAVLGRQTPPPKDVNMMVPHDMLMAMTTLVMMGGERGGPRADAVKLQPGAAGRWVVDSVNKNTGTRIKETRTFTIQ